MNEKVGSDWKPRFSDQEAVLPCRHVICSTTNKEGLIDFMAAMIEHWRSQGLGTKIYSSGGTWRELHDKGHLIVHEMSELTGYKEVFGDLLKTLSAQVAAGLLVTDEYRPQLENLGWPWFDMLVGNFYELELTAAKEGATNLEVVEATDVGGPTMAHEVFKGVMLGSDRMVIEDPADYPMVMDWFKAGEPDRVNFRKAQAVKAEYSAARHLVASVNFHGKDRYFGLIGEVKIVFLKGENAHQSPGYFVETNPKDPFSLSKFELVAGNSASFNNAGDISRLLKAIRRMAAAFDLNFGEVPCIAIAVKHGNACGVGVDKDPRRAIEKMVEGDPRAILGGVVMANFAIGDGLAEVLLSHCLYRDEKRRLLDCIVAPDITPAAIAMLQRMRDTCRFMVNSALADLNQETMETGWDIRPAPGGVLVQPVSTFVLDLHHPQMEEYGEPTTRTEAEDLLIAWATGSSSCSNTVTIARDGQLLGNGVAQQDRVTACRLARDRARAMGHDLTGAVAYSDSFFPFVDAVMVLIRAGIKTIFASSGSKLGDDRVKAACRKYGVNLVRLPDAICRGFQH